MASKNVLAPGDIRVGWFLHQRSKEQDQPSAAVLRNENGRLTLTVPISPVESDRATTRWFTGHSVLYSDDPGLTNYDYEPPRSLVFADPRGSVGLVNCRNLGYNATLGGAGEGRLRVGFAVFGAGTFDYSRPTHVRTYIPGMGDWTGMRSIEVVNNPGADGLGAEDN